MDRERLRTVDVAGWPLPDNYLIELGRLSALWASLEAALIVCLSKLAGFNDTNNPVPFILVTHASFPQRLDMLGALCEQLESQHPHLTECSSVLIKLRAAQKVRNKFQHNGLIANPETGQIELAMGTARGKVKISIEPVDILDIRAACFEVHEAQRALIQLVLQSDIPSKLGIP